MSANFVEDYLRQTSKIATQIDKEKINLLVQEICKIRDQNGRIFFIGVGGSAANCSHAVNDFRKIAGLECYAPSDNVSELTARANDDGWDSIFASWLKTSKLTSKDAVFVFSVGGGSLEANISPNIVRAIDLAKSVNATVLGVVGKDNGYTNRVGDVCVVIPTVDDYLITPHAEGFQSIVWHLLVSHPLIKASQTKWESQSTNDK